MEIEAEDQTDLEEKLLIALAVIWTTSGTTTGQTPFSVIFGFICGNKADMIGTGTINQLKGKEAKDSQRNFLLSVSYIRRFEIGLLRNVYTSHYHEQETSASTALTTGRECGFTRALPRN